MKIVKLVATWISILTLCSCGSNSGDSAGIDASGSPIASQGTIDGFGSVIVNGVRFESSKAEIYINGQIATEGQLHVGYQVFVTGTRKNNISIAEKIEFFPQLVGSISDINESENRIRVLNQWIQINRRTLFGTSITPNDIRGLTVGDFIQVSGRLDEQQVLVATRVAIGSGLVQLSGAITNLDQTNKTFSLQNVSVNYTSAVFSNIDNNQLANNMRVNIRGIEQNGTIQAQQVFGIKTTFESNIKKAEIEGHISRIISVTDFDVDGIACRSTTQTIFKNGTLANLILNAEVEIKGSVSSNGVLVAEQIQFEQPDENHLEGTVSAIHLSTVGEIVIGTLEIGNAIISTTSSTRYEDQSEASEHRFNFASIQVGNYLEITGYNANNNFIATKIERRKTDSGEEREFEWEGQVTAVGVNTLTLLGNTVNLAAGTEFRNENKEPVDLATFLGLALNKRVKIQGTSLNGVYTATRVEIEESSME